MTPAEIIFVGQCLWLLPAGAVFIPETRTLIVADLHFEKATSRRDHGILLPPGDTSVTLDHMIALIDDLHPRTLIALGDSFHDARAIQRFSPENRCRLDDITRKTSMIWIVGNHDARMMSDFSGAWVDEWKKGNLVFRHIPGRVVPGAAGELAGHLHPKIRLRLKGHTISRRCFVVGENRLILPAFGAYTGGLDIDHPEFRTLFPDGKSCFLLGKSGVYRSP